MWVDGIKETTVQEFGSGQSTTGAEPVCISGDADFECRRGVVVKADFLYPGEAVFVGGPTVDGATGFILRGNESQHFEIDRTGKVFIVGSREGLRFSWAKF